MSPSLLITIFLVLLNGFFVAAEFAIVKVRASQLELKANAWDVNARMWKRIINHLDAYLSATQLGITLASLGLGWVGEDAFSGLIIRIMHTFGIVVNQTTAEHIALPIAFFLITMLHIVFGELAPKSMAIRHPLKITMSIAWPLRVFYLIFWPLIWLFNSISNLVLKMFGIRDMSHNEAHSEEEIKLLLTQSEEHGNIPESSNELIQNVFDFDDRIIRHIYVPRSRVCAIDIDTPQQENIDFILNEWYSRVPVYQDDLDNIIGIIHTKDLFKKRKNSESFSLKEIIRPALIVPLTQKIELLLKEFQQKHTQIAIVKNEHGETAGIVTMEDIIEELIGDIQDEHDDEIPLIIEKKPGVYIINTDASISDINDVLPHEITESDSYDTVWGLTMTLFGKIPNVYDTISFGKYEITVVKKIGDVVELVRWKVL